MEVSDSFQIGCWIGKYNFRERKGQYIYCKVYKFLKYSKKGIFFIY